jgi:hypothetical protein
MPAGAVSPAVEYAKEAGEYYEMSTVVILAYAFPTVLIAGILFWRYKREPQRWPFFLGMFALWLFLPVAVLTLPPGWIPDSKPGHPSWLSVIALALLVGAIAFDIRRQPSRWRRYVVVGPFIAALVLLEIVYPLVWER